MTPAATASVLIVGAGPSGLMLTLELCRHGVRPRLVDSGAGPSPLSRAVVVHARTLELLDRHGLAEAFVARGEVARGIGLRVRGRVAATVPLGELGQCISPFPFMLLLSQDQTERLLREALATYRVAVEWDTHLTALSDGLAADPLTITLQNAAGVAQTVRPAYVAGCDGAHSAVRHALNIGFPGGTYEQVFFVADAVVEGLEATPAPSRLVQISVGARTFNGFIPMPGGRTRIIGLLPAGLAPEEATFERLRPALEAAEHVRVRTVQWFSTYKIHHRVAAAFRHGPVFLVGDAGHVHSPAGGQGMNTGMGDAVNLGWKLAAVLRGQAPAALLDTYAAERMPFAQQLVATTDRAFMAATRPSGWASWLRTQVLLRLLPWVLRMPFVRRRLFRLGSQTGIAYPNSPLSQGTSPLAQGGARLPWVAGLRYTALRQPGWQLFSVGKPTVAAGRWARQQGLPLTAVAPGPDEVPGLLYLVRPDGYVGLMAPAFDQAQFSTYARQWGLGAEVNSLASEAVSLRSPHV